MLPLGCLLPKGNTRVCASPGATPSSYSQALQNLQSDFYWFISGRIPGQPSLHLGPTLPLNYSQMDPFNLRGHSSFSPRITRIFLKLFCQHADQAGFVFNDSLMLLLHSYKDCFDTSRIFDSLVKIKYYKLNKNYPWIQKSLINMNVFCRIRSGLTSQLAVILECAVGANCTRHRAIN